MLTYEELLTVLVEIECVLNSRPLCYIYDDSVDDVITPSHLLFGRRLLSSFQEDVDPENVEFTPATLSKRAKHINRLTKQFWNSWKREYLVGLREHHNCRNRIPPKQISVGEVVLIEEKLPRNRWKMGIVTEVHVGRDAHVRGCKVRTLTRNTNRVTYLNRPVNKLYPLEGISTNYTDI